MSTVTKKKLGGVGGGESTFYRGQRSLTFLIALKKINLAIQYSRWMILVSKYRESYEKETQNKI